MNSDITQQGGFGDDNDAADPLDPAQPGVDPADLPGGGNLPDREGEIPLDPEDDAPLDEDDPVSDDNPGAMAI